MRGEQILVDQSLPKKLGIRSRVQPLGRPQQGILRMQHFEFMEVK